MAEVDDYLSRLGTLRKLRAPLHDDWNTIDMFVLRRQPRFGRQNEIKDFERRFKGRRGDNTAGKALDNLASGTESLMFGREPYRVMARDDRLRDDPAVEKVADALSERLNGAMLNDRAGFAPVRRKIFMGCAAHGCSAMFTGIDTGRKSLTFQHVPLPQVFLSEDHRGAVDTVYREFSLTARQAIQRFGDRVHPSTREVARRDPEQAGRYLMVVEPVSEISTMARVVHVDVNNNMIVGRGMWRMPRFHAVRWESTEESPYGWSPVLRNLDDIKGINKQRESNYRAVHQLINPQVYVAGGGYKYIGESPNAIVHYRPSTTGGTLQFERMPGPENVPISLEMIQADQASIREGLFAHLLNVPISPDMTATEFLGRLQEIVRAIGPAIGRLISEWGQPAAAAAFDLMYRDFAFTDILDGTPFESAPPDIWHIDFVSPVDRARDQDEANSILQMVQFAAAVGGVEPIAARTLDGEEAVRQLRDKIGAPAEILRDDDAMRQLRDTLEGTEALQQGVDIAGRAASAGRDIVELNREIA